MISLMRDVFGDNGRVTHQLTGGSTEGCDKSNTCMVIVDAKVSSTTLQKAVAALDQSCSRTFVIGQSFVCKTYWWTHMVSRPICVINARLEDARLFGKRWGNRNILDATPWAFRYTLAGMFGCGKGFRRVGFAC